MSTHEPFRSIPWLRSLPEAAREEVCAAAQRYVLERGQALPDNALGSDRVRFVGAGMVKRVHRKAEGRETIISVITAGELHDWAGWHQSDPSVCSRSLQSHTTVVALPRAAVDRISVHHPPAATALSEAMASCCHELQARVQELAIHPMARRIPHTLARLAARAGRAQGDGTLWLPTVLSRQDVADLCGTTVETTIRVMSRLQQQGAVTQSTDGLTIARDWAADHSGTPQSVSPTHPR